MQLHSFVVAALAGAIGLVAGRTTRSAAPPVAPPPVPGCPAPAVVHAGPVPALEPEPEPQPEAASDDGGEDVSAVLARAARRTAELRLQRDGIVGRVTDARDGSPLVGATVVASSPALPTAQTAITNYDGRFELYDLRAGTYTLTYYYGDVTVERGGVSVSDLDLTSLTDNIDPTPPPPPPWTVTFSGENEYVIEAEE